MNAGNGRETSDSRPFFLSVKCKLIRNKFIYERNYAVFKYNKIRKNIENGGEVMTREEMTKHLDSYQSTSSSSFSVYLT